MSTLPEQFAQLLGQVKRGGDFYAAGSLEIHAPRLEVEGLGPVALPLLAAQAEQLIALAEQAPYGFGTETLTDTAVRRTWQLGAERVHLKGKGWESDLAEMVRRAVEVLGVDGPVEAQFYKLLVYGAGDFFVGHRDTEKAPGMFATLVIVLPSDYRGGELLIRHQGREAALDLRREEPAEAAFAAFYADCIHEVRPIAEGYRLTLIYNLVRPARSRKKPPLAPDHTTEQQRLAEFLRAWGQGDERPDKLVFPLEHAYTEAEIGFDTLKGADRPKGQALAAAAREAECEATLALLRIEESGSAERCYETYDRRGWDDDDDDEYEEDYGEDDDYEIGEVIDRSATLSHWRRPDGTAPRLGALPFLDAEIAPPDALEGMDPDELEFSEATGNAGASFDRLYTLAALVVWPRNRRMAVVAQAGITAALGLLAELVGNWREKGAKPDAPLRGEAERLVAAILRQWPSEAWRAADSSRRGDTAVLLRQLIALEDDRTIDRFLKEHSAKGAYDGADNLALVECLQRLPAPRAGELLNAIVGHNAPARPAACAELLARLAEIAQPIPADAMRSAAAALFAAVTDPPPEAILRRGWVSPEDRIALVAGLLIAFERSAPEFALKAVAWFLKKGAEYGPDEALLPAALRLYGEPAQRELPSVRRLRELMVEHLQRRVGESLEPPADWARTILPQCTCTKCRDLARFLADPKAREWRHKAAQNERGHLEQSIKLSGCDLDCTTDTRGRPYTLICTKNQASYARRAEQRKGDLNSLKALGA